VTVQIIVFVCCALICGGGALGVVLARQPVHAALSLVATLFGIAVLFIAQNANFLAAVQVIVYAGAIVVLFLFVIMLLGVDRADDLESEPITGQRPLALVAGLLIGGGLVTVLVAGTITGVTGGTKALTADRPDIEQLAEVVFTDYLFAFEITSALLVIAVVGAFLLARRGTTPAGDAVDVEYASDEPVADEPVADEADDLAERTS
jgi:NADH-quinone oxidoreductase subunit J